MGLTIWQVFQEHKGVEHIPTPIEVARNTMLQEAQNLNSLVTAIVLSYSQKAREFGLDALLADLPEDLSKAMRAEIQLLEMAWSAASPEPFPAMPALPVPQPVPTEPEEGVGA